MLLARWNTGKRLIYRHIKYASTKSHSFQHSLNLPKTTFPVRSSLEASVRHLIPQCSQQVYSQQLKEFTSQVEKIPTPRGKLEYCRKQLFVLHDGPPYANGDIHLGHALNKILKDIILRYHMLQLGQFVFYKPGWDCHGLPIELKALGKLPKGKSLNDPLQIRAIAHAHAQKTQLRQREQFEKFAILTNWEDPYLTMDREYEVDQLKIFQKFYSKGFIKRRNKPVYWGTETKTALAESELEYNENHISKAIYVKFPLTKDSSQALIKSLKSGSKELQGIDNIKCMIWTTTPWTLFANRAICFNESFTYCLLHDLREGEYLIIAKDSLNSIPFETVDNYHIVAMFQGKDLNGLHYTNPLITNQSKECPLLPGLHVTNATGTGLVHTAPGHGTDDYLIGIENNLKIFSPVDDRGNYDLTQFENNPDVKQFLVDPKSPHMGRNVLSTQTTSHIIDKLNELKMLFACNDYKHSYPYDWRSKKPVIIRSTPQWFINLTDIKDMAQDTLNNVNFVPSRGESRLRAFIKNRNEWCISRQRVWGVPIPYFQHKDDPNIVLMDDKIISHIISEIEQNGIDSWFAKEESTGGIEHWFPNEYKHLASQYIKGKDTMDVWLDSGTSWTILERFYKKELHLEKLPQPLSNLYLEGSDQHRGWFQSSLLVHIGATSGGGKSVSPPFQSVLTHGFILDSKGVKMSKSLGNIISPEDIIKGNNKQKLPAIGVDGLRYFVAQTDFSSDIMAGSVVMNRVKDSLKRLRLTFKFILGNLNKTEEVELVPYEQLRPIDKYTLGKLSQLLHGCEAAYASYNFAKVLTLIQYHLTNELSSFYLDVSKDILYSESVTSPKRKQVQTILFNILDTYRHILTPILPVLLQEVWNHMPEQWRNLKEVDNKDVSMMNLPRPDLPYSENDMVPFSQLHLPILKLFQTQWVDKQKEIKSINKTGQLDVTIYYTNSENRLGDLDINEVTDLLQVAHVYVKHVNSENYSSILSEEINVASNIPIKMVLSESPDHKCPRCWKHTSKDEESLCNRCADVVNHS